MSGLSIRRPVAIATLHLAASLSVLAGCERGAGGAAATRSVADTTNVPVVVLPAGEWPDGEGWRLEAEPALSIGVVEGASAYQFAGINAGIRLDDGRIVVADFASREIRFFDARGVHLRSSGRQGGGPGEYKYPQLIARYGADSLLVWDALLSRGTILGTDGTVARTLDRPDVDASPQMRDAFADGALLGGFSRGIDPPDRQPRMIRSVETFYRYHPSGQLDTLGVFFTDENYSSGSTLYYQTPFARTAVAAASGDRFYYGSSDTYEIRAYSSRGELLHVSRSARTRPVTRADVDEARGEHAEPNRYVGMQWPESWPAFAAFEADRAGNLWIADYPLDEDVAQGWTVLDPDGAFLTRVVTPPRFKVLEIGSDYVLGAASDELDVERVVLHRLIKPVRAVAARGAASPP